ncbi:MAG: type II secretion system protein [Candidatus Nomurabacteria bacterium]|nr:type II secretion system protein [Candidatus Nomurabacteria bacterium]
MSKLNKKNYIKYIQGFSLIEVLIATSVLGVLAVILMSSTNKGIILSNQALDEVQASFLLEEGSEAVKSLRDTNWTNISGVTDNTNYYLAFNNTTNVWSLSATPSKVDSFTRVIVFSPVYRDSNDDIASSGTLDAGTKKVTVTTSWTSNGNTISKSVPFYISNIFN